MKPGNPKKATHKLNFVIQAPGPKKKEKKKSVSDFSFFYFQMSIFASEVQYWSGSTFHQNRTDFLKMYN